VFGEHGGLRPTWWEEPQVRGYTQWSLVFSLLAGAGATGSGEGRDDPATLMPVHTTAA
jgi:hypothetical protein